MKTPVRLAADIGGTFTDVVLERGEERFSTKLLTTTDAPEQAVLDGMSELLDRAGIAADAIDVFIHGTTLATNALIERKGAKVAFVTTEGFRDIVETGYEKRFDHYDLMIDAVPPIVPRALRFTVPERIAADGSVLLPMDEARLEDIARQITESGAQAVAIGFLHAYAHPAHEKRAREILSRHLADAVTICVSHEVCPEIREYERFSTTCANASVRPLMSSYLHRLRDELAARGVTAPLFLMMSGGGLTTLENAARFPIRLVESGPAGGAILAGHISRQCGLGEVLSFDMGGTTAKICLITNGEPQRNRLFEIARTYRDMKGSGWPVRIPVIEMVEIGAGGGSIARVDAMNRIVVGPDSAGSNPGPVSYGRGGTEPTVTDANIALGKIDPEWFAAGTLSLDEKGAKTALSEKIGDRLGLEGDWPAAGVAEIVEENMANAARVHAIERGKAIGACTMIAFGGAAPLHACRLAEKLGIDRIIVPRGAGVGSAIGFLRAPVAYEVTRSMRMAISTFDAAAANTLLGDMAADAEAVVLPALKGETPRHERIVDMRYVGQGHEIRVALPEGALDAGHGGALRTRFEALYRDIYGLTLPGVDVEIVTWSVTVASPKPASTGTDRAPGKGEARAVKTRRVFDPARGEAAELPVFWRPDLGAGAYVEGPAIIAENETTTIVSAGFAASIDAFGYIAIERLAAHGALREAAQ